MNISGIFAQVGSEDWKDVTATLSQLPGIGLHQEDPETGKLVLTLEAEADEDQMDGLKWVQKIPGVHMAELVYHYFDEDEKEEKVSTFSV
jgi:nitrate reductase NapAB chaperone NapD